MKIILEYDPATGELRDDKGNHLTYIATGLGNLEYKKNPVADVKELVSVGISVDDILKLKREGAILND